MSSSDHNPDINSPGKIVKLVTSHYWIVLFLFLSAAVLIGSQAGKFRVDASSETLLMKNNVNYINTQVVNARFSPQEFLLVAYKPKTAGVFSAQTLDALGNLGEEISTLERVESVRSILNVPLLSLSDNLLDPDIDPAQWTIPILQPTEEALADLFSGHPVYEDLIIDKAQTTTAIQVLFTPDAELNELESSILELQRSSLDNELTPAQKEALDQLTRRRQSIQDELNQIRQNEIETIRLMLTRYEDDADIYLGGIHVLGFQLVNIIKNDLLVFGGAIALIISLTLLVVFRELRWVLVPLICCAVSLVATIGLFGILGLRATVISANFVALQLILTLAIVIHLIVQYREYQKSEPEMSHRQLVQATLKEKVNPCFYAGITTSIGFASLLLSNIQPVISFGWMMIVAMMVSILVSLILFPTLLMLMSGGKRRGQAKISSAIVMGLSKLSLGFPGLIVIACSAIFALSVAGLFRLSVENSFLNYFRDSTTVKKELSFIDQNLGGTTALDISYTIPSTDTESDLVLTAETVQLMQQLHAQLEELTGMGKVFSVVNFTELAMKITGGIPLTEYELTVLYATLDASLREDLIGSYFDAQSNQLRISARIKDSTEGLKRTELLEKVQLGLAELGIETQNYQLTGLFVLYEDILQRLFRSQILSLGLVYLGLTMAFLLVFRSLRLACIGIVPNIFSTLLVLGTMGWLNIPLDLMTITIASIAMGIAVDDTIHYLHRYQKELQRSGEPDQESDIATTSARDNGKTNTVKIEKINTAISNSHSSVGLAMLYTTLLVTLGFSMLSFSDFTPSILFGLLTGLAMIIALLADLTLLPVLLHRFYRKV